MVYASGLHITCSFAYLIAMMSIHLKYKATVAKLIALEITQKS
jgi:hypothetical protein